MKLKTWGMAGVAILLAAQAGWAADLDAQAMRQKANAFFKPLPATMPGSANDTKELQALGQKLYFETALSVNGSQSCNSCHRLDKGLGGDDNLPVSPGAKPGTHGDRSAPTVWNAGLQFVQFWDGRAADLKEQAKGPILNPVEMGMPDEAAVIASLKKAGYGPRFDKAFGKQDALTYDNVAGAIAAFERTLVTSDRFDDFLKGNDKALSQTELAGLDTFINTGCTACHSGATLGGQMYQKAGLARPWPNLTDKGRFNATGKVTDTYFFKVPMLRNIAKTAPYFHNGSAATLEQAVHDMAYYQLGVDLDKPKVDSIVAFLKTLNNTKKTSF